jgi:hypothetical protein
MRTLNWSLGVNNKAVCADTLKSTYGTWWLHTHLMGVRGKKNNILLWNVVVPILPKLTCNLSSRVHIHAKLPTEFAATRVDFLPAVR